MTATTTINRAEILAQAVSLTHRFHELTAERRVLLFLRDEITPELLDELDQEDAEVSHMCEVVRRLTAGNLTPKETWEITRCVEYLCNLDQRRVTTGSQREH